MKYCILFLLLVCTTHLSYGQQSGGQPKSDLVFNTKGIEAKFPGNLNQWIADHLDYPEKAREKGIEGTVYVKFIVTQNGHLSNIKVAKSSGSALLDAEGLRVVRLLPPWTPAKKKNGKGVKSYYTLPITFKLD